MERVAWDKLHSGMECWFLGMASAQFYIDYYIWELFFLRHKIRNMVELGTGQGALSIFFLLQSKQNSFFFNTFDINTPGYLFNPVAEELEFSHHFYGGNIFEDQKDTVMDLLINYPKPTLLYCDSGKKVREIQTFSPHLQIGDYVAVHDWNTEVYQKDIPNFLVEILTEECDEMNSLTRFFEKV